MNKISKYFYLAALLVTTSLLSSCAGTINTHELAPRATVMPLVQSSISGKIALVLNDDFENYTYIQRIVNKEHRYPVGKTLSRDVEQLIRVLFSDVTIIHAASGQTMNIGIPMISPSVSGVNVPSGAMWAWEERTIGFPLQWKVTSPSGEIVWVKTVIGEGRGPAGNSASNANNIVKDLNTAIANALSKSYSAINEAEEIRMVLSTSH